ncbi:MAG: AtpZ/AtpI family protein [Patescibacteria group bacterium]|jgi:F0F1-type ATP synthase assembly protein I
MNEDDQTPQGLDDSKKKSKEKAWWTPALILFFRFSSWIAFPVLIGAFIGNWVDDKYNGGKSFYLFFLIGLSFFVSMFGLVREAGREFKRIEEEEDEKKSKK